MGDGGALREIHGEGYAGFQRPTGQDDRSDFLAASSEAGRPNFRCQRIVSPEPSLLASRMATFSLCLHIILRLYISV